VWLGTAPGVVQSWSDGAVVALVAAGSATGSARVLQNGVMSNAVPFTVDALQITGLSPASGAPGTSVTISGSGFGSAQGSGIVLLGQFGTAHSNQVLETRYRGICKLGRRAACPRRYRTRRSNRFMGARMSVLSRVSSVFRPVFLSRSADSSMGFVSARRSVGRVNASA
jgi:hypothetical protein